MIYGGNKMFKFMLKIADFLVKNGYIEAATDKKHMKKRIEFSLEAITCILCLLIIWNATILMYQDFKTIHIAMGYCIFDLIFEGFRMKYFICKLNLLQEIENNVEKSMQKKISCIWGLTLIIWCVYCINCNISIYSFKCTMTIIICIILSIVQIMRIETDLNNYVFK